MGQKSNPNSFQIDNKTPFNSSSLTKLGYSNLFIRKFFIENFFKVFFIRRNCIIKSFHLIIDPRIKRLTIFISFFKMYVKAKKKRRRKRIKKFSKLSSILSNLLNRYGFSAYFKRFCFKQLNKKPKRPRKVHSLSRFFREVYFFPFINLLRLMKKLPHNNSLLLGKLISIFYKRLHRSKKVNRFFFFLNKFLLICFRATSLKGIKVILKGRLRGSSRSKTRVFKIGQIPLQTIVAKIDYSFIPIFTSYGVFGLKVWMYH